MALDEQQVVSIHDDFYRDSFGKVVFLLISMVIAIGLLISLSVYLYLNKPPPVIFSVDDEWRVQPPVPLDQPYLAIADVLQWVSDALPAAFVYDFNHYNEQLKRASQYFTTAGWKVFLNHLNTYANYNNVLTNKMFLSGSPGGAPFILNQGMLSGRYAWWVQMPMEINYAGYAPLAKQSIVLQVLVVRVSTLNNLSGVAIDNVIISKNVMKKSVTGAVNP